MCSPYDIFGAVILTTIIVTLTIGLLWSITTSDRLSRELKRKEND